MPSTDRWCSPGPQNNINTLNFLDPEWHLEAHRFSWSLQGVLYYRQYGQTVSNGNTTDYEACTNTTGILCQPDGVTPLTNSAGQTLPDISDGGALHIGVNDFEVIHAWGRGGTLQVTDGESFLGHDNQFSAGASIDYAANAYFTDAQIGVINSQLLVLPSDLIVYTPENSPRRHGEWRSDAGERGLRQQELGRVLDRYFQRHA